MQAPRVPVVMRVEFHVLLQYFIWSPDKLRARETGEKENSEERGKRQLANVETVHEAGVLRRRNMSQLTNKNRSKTRVALRTYVKHGPRVHVRTQTRRYIYTTNRRDVSAILTGEVKTIMIILLVIKN